MHCCCSCCMPSPQVSLSCFEHYSLLTTMEASIAEEEYIDMDVSSATLTRPPSPPSPPPPRDFEFQMSGKPLPEMDGITSPADELFYEGKLLPLVHKQLLLLRDSSTPTTETTANANANANANAATPYYSCNASPATSRYVSGELDPESYFSDECRTEEPAQPRAGGRSWAKKLRLIKQSSSSSSSSLSLKLKASRAYLKSLFSRSGCSDESCAVPNAKDRPSGRQAKNKASSSLRRVDAAEKVAVSAEGGRGHRRSFSGAIKRRGAASHKSSSTSSSSSSSSNSSSFSSVHSNKRSSSGSSEAECSIQGAIAYCKKSQQEARARKTASDVEFYSAATAAALAASRIAADCEKQERPEICRG